MFASFLSVALLAAIPLRPVVPPVSTNTVPVAYQAVYHQAEREFRRTEVMAEEGTLSSDARARRRAAVWRAFEKALRRKGASDAEIRRLKQRLQALRGK